MARPKKSGFDPYKEEAKARETFQPPESFVTKRQKQRDRARLRYDELRDELRKLFVTRRNMGFGSWAKRPLAPAIVADEVRRLSGELRGLRLELATLS
jgi:hypothetical protein